MRDNIRDQIDFVIWTGDNARHDNDESYPRNSEQVLGANRVVASKMYETFSADAGGLELPVVPTFGNNDFLPHNIMVPGPNRWFIDYADIWGPFIPEEQRHQFEYGGWFYTEVVPNKLVVFSLNTMFFFDRNAAVDGCALASEPGYKHMEWLRVQLQRLRVTNVKAILMGHVPPARTATKQNWDETCWQRYTLWLRQYRDVVIGSLFGHMNIDHFVLQDTHDIDEEKLLHEDDDAAQVRESIDFSSNGEFGVMGRTDYLQDIRKQWSQLPGAAADSRESLDVDALDDGPDTATLGKKKKKEKSLKKIGGKYGERYHISIIGPSVIPNYFPTMRVYEYNISGIEDNPVWKDVHGTPSTIQGARLQRAREHGFAPDELRRGTNDHPVLTEAEFKAQYPEIFQDDIATSVGKKKKKKGKKGKDSLVIPDGPNTDAPPGPAYMPQTLSWLAYTQYFANLTRINNEAEHDDGKKHKTHPVEFEVEYDTRNDDLYRLKDLTVRELLKLAHSIGIGGDQSSDADEVVESEGYDGEPEEGEEEAVGDGLDVLRKKKGKKKGKKKNDRDRRNHLWIGFLRRAFVGTMDDDDLEKL